MLVYLLIFCIAIFVIGCWGLIEFLRNGNDDKGAIAFFTALAATSGTAVGFCISLLANS